MEKHAASRPVRSAILLHGFAGTGRDWAPLLPAFSPDTDAYAVDLPGHGGSPWPAGGLDFPGMAKALAALPEALGVERPVWVGYSFGARLLIGLAVEHPGAAGGLVLISPRPGIAAPQRAARVAEDAQLANLLEMQGMDAFLHAWHARTPFDSRRGKPGWDAFVAQQRRNDPHALAACLRSVGSGAQPDYTPRLKEIRSPTLLVAGFEDVTYNALARTMQLVMPRARRATIAGAGHAPHTEKPEATREVVRAFLNDLPNL